MLERCLHGVEDVYHLAAAVGGVTTDISTFFEVNATGTARLFEAIDAKGFEVRKIVSASSQAVYGEGLYRCVDHGVVQPKPRTVERMKQGRWEPVCPHCGGDLEPALTDETARWNGETPYAVSKIASERAVIGLGKRLGIPTVALRFAVVYGPRQSIYNPYTGILSIFSTLILNGRQPRAFEDGRETRDFVFVTDIVRATILAMESDATNWDVFNVGRGAPIDILTVLEQLSAALGRKPDYVISGEFRPGDARHLVLDSSRLRSLGWEAATTLEAGLGHMAEWFAKLGDIDDFFSGTVQTLRERGVVIQGATS